MINFVQSCVRTTDQQNIDYKYIRNIRNSIYDIFAPYFHNHLKLTFRNMLKAQHKSIVNNNYCGYTNPINKVPQSLIRDEINISLYQPLLKKEWYVEELKNLNSYINETINVEIFDIPKEMWHHVENTKEGLRLYLPPNKYVKYYINQMEKIMNYFREGNQSLDMLAYYIQLGVICHPFEKVNFSLIMSQVNYILDFWGYNPINHEYLDFECFLNSTKKIIESFKKKVNKGNHNG